jgi:hypothetical protein
MPDSMIERVARAIYEDRNGAGCVPWARRGGEIQRPYLSDARAAIVAMREPTKGMVSSGQSKCDDYLDSVECWITMIDAALKESP